MGKTSTIWQFLRGEFLDSYQPTVHDEFDCDLVVDDVSYPIRCVDLAGQSDMKIAALERAALRHADAVVVMFAIDNIHSYQNVPTLVRDASSGQKSPIIAIACNKEDKNDGRQGLITTAQFEGSFGDQFPTAILGRTSALRGTGVPALFQDIVRQVVDKRAGGGGSSGRTKKNKNKRGRCTLV